MLLRYQSAADLLADLRRFQRDGGTTSVPAEAGRAGETDDVHEGGTAMRRRTVFICSFTTSPL